MLSAGGRWLGGDRAPLRTPPAGEIELDGIERRGTDPHVALHHVDLLVEITGEAQHLEGLCRGVHQPHEPDPMRGIDALLDQSIEAGGGGGEHLAGPVRGEAEPGVVGQLGESIVAPAGQGRDEDVLVPTSACRCGSWSSRT